MDKLNILYIIWSLDQGGAERVVIDLVKNLDSSKFNITICCLNEKGVYARELEKIGIEVIPLFKRPKFDPFIIYKISKIITQRKIDIAVTHLWTSNFWGRIAAYLSGVKVIIATEHTTDENRSWYYHLADRILSIITSKIIAVSSSVKEFHEKRSKIPSCKFEVINNGIEIDKFNISVNRNKKRNEFHIKPNDFLIGLFGRFVPAKAHEVLLQSLKNVIKTHPHVKVLFVGSGPTEKYIIKIASDLGLMEQVIFAGFRKDIPELYRILDLFVLTSIREGFPVTLLEAMASGVPAIVTNVGGNKDIINDGKNGFIIEPNDVTELTRRINYIIEHPDSASNIAETATETVRKQFTSEIMTRNTEKLFLKLLAQNNKHKSRIKLLLVIDHLDPGGAQRQVIELAKRLPHSEFEITVCSLDGTRAELASEIEEINIPVHSINQHGFFDLKSLVSLYNFIKQNSFDIVHTYLFTADTYGRIAAFSAHTHGIIASLRSVDTWKNRIHIFTDRILALITDRILVNVRTITSFLVEKEHISSKKIFTIYNGIDLKNLRITQTSSLIRKELHVGKQEKLVGIFARNDTVKDHATFFQAVQIISNKNRHIKFLAMGDSMRNESTKSILKELNVEGSVILRDHSPNYLDYIASVDVSVLTSLIEGCSNVILESMALGKPVVATAVGGNPELVVEGKTGYLVAPRDPAGLAKAIIKIIDNPILQEYFGKNGQQRVKKYFSMEKMIDETVKTYRIILKNKKNYH